MLDEESIRKVNLIYMGGSLLLLLCILGLLIFDIFFNREEILECESKDEVLIKEIEDIKKEDVVEEDTNIEVERIKVDVKGAVKKAGVYELDSNARVNDAILMAGGLKSTASTKYLNLSKKVTDEMVIFVYTVTQIKNLSIEENLKEECKCPTIDISSCAGSNVVVPGNSDTNGDLSNEDNSNTNNKVSLNKATKEELMTVSGIGESKALAIIKYREDNGEFKVLEDIMNVSGIGESLYNKIKDYITL